MSDSSKEEREFWKAVVQDAVLGLFESRTDERAARYTVEDMGEMAMVVADACLEGFKQRFPRSKGSSYNRR
jgi:hypothetical protein